MADEKKRSGTDRRDTDRRVANMPNSSQEERRNGTDRRSGDDRRKTSD